MQINLKNITATEKSNLSRIVEDFATYGFESEKWN